MNTSPYSTTLTQNRFNISISSVTEWTITLYLFIMSTPVFTWTRTYLFWIASFLFLFSIYSFIKIGKFKDHLYQILLVVAYNYLMFRYALINDSPFLFYIFLIFSFIPFIWIKSTVWSNIFHNYMLLFAITIIPSLLQYILVNFCEVDFPYDSIDASPFNPHEGSTYIQYSLFVKELRIGEFLPRFYGFYDEPGAVGTISMVLLFCNKYNLKKWYNIVFVLVGICSFSLFFYVSSLIYTLFWGKLKVKLLVLFICVGVLIFASENEVISRYIIDRFIIKDGEWTGYNRENYSFEFIYEQFTGLELLLGIDSSKYLPFAASYKYWFAVCGIIPTLLFCGLYFLWAYMKLKTLSTWDFILCMLIPLLVLAQRPFINNSFYIFLTVVPVHFFWTRNFLHPTSINGKTN